MQYFKKNTVLPRPLFSRSLDSSSLGCTLNVDCTPVDATYGLGTILEVDKHCRPCWLTWVHWLGNVSCWELALTRRCTQPYYTVLCTDHAQDHVVKWNGNHQEPLSVLSTFTNWGINALLAYSPQPWIWTPANLTKAVIFFGALLTNFLIEAVFSISSSLVFSNYSCMWVTFLFAFWRKKQSMGRNWWGW